MSDDVVSSDFVPPVCEFFRAIMAEPDFTPHDPMLAMRHTETCVSCYDTIGQLIHIHIESNKQAETSGA